MLASAQKKHYCAQQQSRDFLLPSFHSTSVFHSYIFTPNVTLIVQNLIYIKEEKKEAKTKLWFRENAFESWIICYTKAIFFFIFLNVWSLTKHQECIMYFNNVWLAHMVPINWALGCLRSDVRPQIFTASNLCHAGMHSKWHLSILQEMDAIMNSELLKHSLLQLHISISNW